MKKKLLSMILAISMMISMIGCGTKEVAKEVQEIESTEEIVAEPEVSENDIAEEEPVIDEEEEITGGYTAPSASNIFVIATEKLGDGKIKCNVSIDLEFAKVDCLKAIPGDTLTSFGGKEYLVVDSEEIFDSISDATEDRSHARAINDWLTVGIKDGDTYYFLKYLDDRIVARDDVSDGSIIENTDSCVLTIAEDAEIVMDNMMYSGNPLTITGKEFYELAWDYSTVDIEGDQTSIPDIPAGHAEIEDGIITKLVLEWME